MKRIGKENFNKKRKIAFISFAIFVIFSILLALFPIAFPQASYEELKETTIVISEVDSVYGGWRVSDYIYTNEDEVFLVSGSEQYDRLEETIKPGTTAKIKWGKSAFHSMNLIEELKIGGQTLVEYDNDNNENIIVCCVIALILILIDFIILKIRLWHIKHLEMLEQKRDIRIAKKYGNNANENNKNN